MLMLLGCVVVVVDCSAVKQIFDQLFGPQQCKCHLNVDIFREHWYSPLARVALLFCGGVPDYITARVIFFPSSVCCVINVHFPSRKCKYLK